MRQAPPPAVSTLPMEVIARAAVAMKACRRHRICISLNVRFRQVATLNSTTDMGARRRRRPSDVQRITKLSADLASSGSRDAAFPRPRQRGP